MFGIRRLVVLAPADQLDFGIRAGIQVMCPECTCSCTCTCTGTRQDCCCTCTCTCSDSRGMREIINIDDVILPDDLDRLQSLLRESLARIGRSDP